MKTKEKIRISRTELAVRLRQLADAVEETGDIRIGDNTAHLPNVVEFELEYDGDPNKGKLELEMEWKPDLV
jgi:amphi-Trp domain-containing protein